MRAIHVFPATLFLFLLCNMWTLANTRAEVVADSLLDADDEDYMESLLLDD